MFLRTEEEHACKPFRYHHLSCRCPSHLESRQLLSVAARVVLLSTF